VARNIRKRLLNMENEHNKAIVLAELRSGLYKQDHGYLHTQVEGSEQPAAFCVLGVVCEAYRKHSGNEDHEWVPIKTCKLVGGKEAYAYKYVGDNPDERDSQSIYETILPPRVAEWAFGDRRATNPWVRRQSGYRTVSALNDDYDLSLNQIADALEGGCEWWDAK
jgi:hypothetical protein